MKGFKKQSVNPSAENTFNGTEFCQGQIMASISHFGVLGNSEPPVDDLDGFFEESSGWATVSNWLERQVEIFNDSVRRKRSAFDPLSIKIRGISLHIIPRNYGILTFRSYSEMGFKLNENLLEPEPTTILPNVFSKVNLSHLWTETVLYRFVTSHVCSYMIPILDFMIQGLV